LVPPEADVQQWDRYHIENYLLEPGFVRAALVAVSDRVAFGDDQAVKHALKAAATALVPRLVLERLQGEPNKRLVSALDIGARRDTADLANDLLPSIEGSVERLRAVGADLLAPTTLPNLEESYRAEFAVALESDEWLSVFPGRPVLERFAADNLRGVSYTAFRNLILDQMVDEGFQPTGMRTVLDQIEA
jgi:hypothetical protein